MGQLLAFSRKQNLKPQSLDLRDVILVVLFDKSTTLGLVRLRVKRAVEELSAIVERLFENTFQGVGKDPTQVFLGRFRFLFHLVSRLERFGTPERNFCHLSETHIPKSTALCFLSFRRY